jgi:DNA-directed RNA polymerase subunit alpha|uniref:RNA polymerase alpha subunit n=1 Tax=Gonyostomum semen TaxID=375454 RepID=UPI0021152917|nr:RNA polymerase alpha subunit [Gonyostomum semen]UTE94338.1 RNA polymerase alpha subunit [Gonyostomum semen]
MTYKIDCVELKTNEFNEQYGKFIFESLERGQSITLGNSLRRILLADLTGVAIVALRIAGINNEFSSIPGVLEDVLEIILNIKEIVLKGSIDQPILGRLKVDGPKIITAGLIEISQVNIVNPNHYIATISDNSVLEMEFKIESGKNYRLTDSKNANDPIDFLQIDAIFMPVRKVNYTIEQVDFYSNSYKEILILEIWTDGSISPSEALVSSGKILQTLLEPLINNNFQTVRSEPSEKEKKLTEIPIEELNLSARAYNGLKRAQINYVGDLLKYSVDDLKEIKNFGQKSIEELVLALKTLFGINLK